MFLLAFVLMCVDGVEFVGCCMCWVGYCVILVSYGVCWAILLCSGFCLGVCCISSGLFSVVFAVGWGFG